MLKKIKNTLFILSVFIFIFFITKHYFSETHAIKVNKNRSLYSPNSLVVTKKLPLLKNNTNNIIEFSNEIEVYKKNKKKYSFWGLLGK